MKKLFSVGIMTLLLASCSTQNTPPTPAIGGQKDKNGCLVAAGQTWSTLRQTCLQVFNEGIRLNPIQQKADEAVFSAFVLYNDNQSKAELFLPREDKSIILDKKASGIYSNGAYEYNNVNGELKKGTEIIYKKDN